MGKPQKCLVPWHEQQKVTLSPSATEELLLQSFKDFEGVKRLPLHLPSFRGGENLKATCFTNTGQTAQFFQGEMGGIVAVKISGFGRVDLKMDETVSIVAEWFPLEKRPL